MTESGPHTRQLDQSKQVLVVQRALWGRFLGRASCINRTKPTSGLGRIAELVARGDGELTVLEATGRDQASRQRLERPYVEARAAEWTEFRAGCARYLAEVGKGKLTVAELEEEEQSTERLRRWHREPRTRDLLATPAALTADQDLKACAAKLKREVDELELQGGRVYLHLGVRRDDPPRR